MGGQQIPVTQRGGWWCNQEGISSWLDEIRGKECEILQLFYIYLAFFTVIKKWALAKGVELYCRYACFTLFDMYHDCVIKWKPSYWPFVRGIHRPIALIKCCHKVVMIYVSICMFTLRPRENGCHLSNTIWIHFLVWRKCVFLFEFHWNLLQGSNWS